MKKYVLYIIGGLVVVWLLIVIGLWLCRGRSGSGPDLPPEEITVTVE